MTVYAVVKCTHIYIDKIYQQGDDYEELTDFKYEEYLERIFEDFASAEHYLKSQDLQDDVNYRVDTYDTIDGINTGTHYIYGY